MGIKLIAFDLDGTLLDDRKDIPAENISTLNAAAEKNIRIVPASGRIYRFMPEPVRTLLSAGILLLLVEAVHKEYGIIHRDAQLQNSSNALGYV